MTDDPAASGTENRREGLSRRDLLKVAGVAGAAAAVPLVVEAQQPEAPVVAPPAPDLPQVAPAVPPAAGAEVDPPVLFFFNDEEAQFIEAVIDRLIPPDPEWTGAVGAGVLYFIDRQLAGPYGQGARLYLQGPWVADAPEEQGYQLRYTPAELVRIGIADVRAHVRDTAGGEVWEMGGGPLDELLRGLEEGETELASVPGDTFFSLLLDLTIQGWFADPAHGGNRDMVAWRMVGFPGAYAQYLELVDIHNLPYAREPVSIANTAARQAHLQGHDH